MGKRSASETADLDAALRFVIRRIEDEANRSGKPLSDEEQLVLNNLPKDPLCFRTVEGMRILRQLLSRETLLTSNEPAMRGSKR
jgi:hypothetical protein